MMFLIKFGTGFDSVTDIEGGSFLAYLNQSVRIHRRRHKVVFIFVLISLDFSNCENLSVQDRFE